MYRLVWDFFGPLSEGTASHFLKHLREFLKKESISEACQTEVIDNLHSLVWCETNDSIILKKVEKSLRPKRIIELEVKENRV